MSEPKWDTASVTALFNLPFFDLILQAHTTHRLHFAPHEVQLSSLLSVKTGACPEDCAYCPQSGLYDTGLKREKLLALEKVIESAKEAKASGATRFCMGAAWRSPPARDFPKILDMIRAVKDLGLETCVTLGMLTDEHAQQLKAAGLDFYNHNLDSSPDFYKTIISTRTYQERLDTIKHVYDSGMKICCGGILGMGETRADRIELLVQLANLPKLPESVPINQLMPVPGTPLAEMKQIDAFEFVRTIAVARIMMPKSMVRLSAGRENMSEELQALCIMAGANSLWLGAKLLTAPNPEVDQDKEMFSKLNITIQKQPATAEHVNECH